MGQRIYIPPPRVPPRGAFNRGAFMGAILVAVSSAVMVGFVIWLVKHPPHW